MPSGYDTINHVVAVRIRLQGTGVLFSQLLALEDDPTQNLADTTMSTTANRAVNLLANMTAERVQYYGYIDAIDERFIIKNISIYTKPVASGYPQ